MNSKITQPDVQHFIFGNTDTDLPSLSLKKSPFGEISMPEIMQQLESRKKAQKKLPSWYGSMGIYYPPRLSMEQSSSEKTAMYKAGLADGKTLIDLTGGLGVDCYYFSRKFESVTHCEMNRELSAIATHNFGILGADNILTVEGNGVDYLLREGHRYDWIYADPSRRHDHKGKVFMLGDCTPDIPSLLPQLFAHTGNILVKTSPLLDISSGLRELPGTREIHIVAVNNEVRELLWVLKKDFNGPCHIHTINYSTNGEQRFGFDRERENILAESHNLPQTFLYEPNAAIMKSGGFRSLSAKTGFSSLHRHSHLYTSGQHIPDFPGRAFRIREIIPYKDKKLLRTAWKDKKAHITTRNFPESVEQLRKKFCIRDGGTSFIFFTIDRNNEKTVLVCDKLYS
ncbi:class I SAM-dependent methyltransferase [Sinomicrobium soli]|uniref:class I SAM-dependent methyltransferase n=1 Tax=Sinomicrobium sp. N-1-3-6 TaxID=2219864 RepID=UPI000DCED08B|nr:class I SAM-dependent methyltransferase [Sinomicrobium sp. N-1-3-6]RAV30668.1 class I SAM-dependent methyltransferase [Sinomicrobium sp. N-1-3-6]